MSAGTASAGPEPHVRPAVDGDAADLSRLAGLARDHARSERGGDVLVATDPARFDPPVPDLDPGHLVLAGCLGDVVVGVAEARAAGTGAARTATVRLCFVEEPARGVGVGRALMEAVVDWAREQGCHGVDAVALPGDRATKNFFEAFGLVARLITVHRTLGGGDA